MGNKKMTPKWSGVKRNGYFKLGANLSITVPDVMRTLNWMLNQIENKPEDIIIILVGIEGDVEGKNWFYEDCGDNDLIAFASNSRMDKDSRFQAKDIDEAIENNLKVQCEKVRDRIEIRDVSKMNIFEFGALLTGEKHVILAYNYGRNDKAVRHYLNLKPVLTYIEVLSEKTSLQKPNDCQTDCEASQNDETNQVDEAKDADPVDEFCQLEINESVPDSMYVYEC